MDPLADWADFHVAIVGATAALAGLVIVAASVNIGDIVKTPSLTSRLAAAIAGLVLALAVAALALVPRIPLLMLGAGALALAVLGLVFAASAGMRIVQNRHPENRLRALKIVLAALTPALYATGAVVLLIGAEDTGLALFAVGAIFAVIAALLVSWIVLVEVLR